MAVQYGLQPVREPPHSDDRRTHRAGPMLEVLTQIIEEGTGKWYRVAGYGRRSGAREAWYRARRMYPELSAKVEANPVLLEGESSELYLRSKQVKPVKKKSTEKKSTAKKSSTRK